MTLHTLSSAAQMLGCRSSRLKGWMEKGYIPETRIHSGATQVRVIDEEIIPKIKRVLQGIDEEGLTVQGAFSRYFKEGEVNWE